MSIFSQPIDTAADVNLFARMVGDRQHLVVGMRLSAPTDVALVIPLPIRRGCGDHEVQLTSLDDSRAFFAALATGFAPPVSARDRRDDEDEDAPRTVRYAQAQPIQTSYVGSTSQLARIDENYHLPRAVLAAQPQYGDYGFLIHVLPAGQAVRVTPLAVCGPARDPSRLYLPTLVAAGGPAPDVVLQDATIYTQHIHHLSLDESKNPAGDFVNTSVTGDLVDPEHLVQRKVVYGSNANADTFLSLS